MKIESKIGIGGRLVGIGKVRLDGTEEFTWLDEPIHNTIVGSGFDQLFKCCPGHDGDDLNDHSDICNNRITFTGSYRPYDGYTPCYERAGVLSYCQIGTDGTATVNSDTSLHAPCSDYSSNVVSGVPWTYVFVGPDGNGDYRIRITHRVTATADASVSEIGWFGRQGYKASYYASWSSTYHMFSRIVLRSPYGIASGEQMIVTYELSIKYADLTPTAVDMGIDASDGTPLKALKQFESNITESTSSGVDIISTSRFGLFSCTQDAVPGMSAHYSVENSSITRVAYSTTDREFVADRNVSFGTDLTQATVTPIVTKGTMVAGSGTRKITFTLPSTWPNLDDSNTYVDIHMLNLDGYTYRFGYYDTDPGTGETVWVPQAWRKSLNETWQITEVVSYVQS